MREEGRLGEEHVRLLRMVDIFEPLSQEEIERINWQHLNTRIPAGETFYTPMDLCETLFVLQSGRVRLYRAVPEGREFTLALLEAGTVFGEMTLTGQRLRGSYAQAMEESEISAMCRTDVERLVLDKPRVGLQLVHLLSERLGAYETRMESLTLKEVPARLACLNFALMESQG
jgi:CRP/FNR family transcriptional regulator